MREVRSGENIPLGNEEEISNFKIWGMKKYLEKCSREFFSPKSGLVVSFLLGVTGTHDTAPSTWELRLLITAAAYFLLKNAFN